MGLEHRPGRRDQRCHRRARRGCACVVQPGNTVRAE
jgi:hypothetical protein